MWPRRTLPGSPARSLFADGRRRGRVEALVFRRAVHRAFGGRDAESSDARPAEVLLHGCGTSGEIEQPVAGDVVAQRNAVPDQAGERHRASFGRQRVAHRAVRIAVEPFGTYVERSREGHAFACGTVEGGQGHGNLEDAQQRQRNVSAADRAAVGCADGDADPGAAAPRRGGVPDHPSGGCRPPRAGRPRGRSCGSWRCFSGRTVKTAAPEGPRSGCCRILRRRRYSDTIASLGQTPAHVPQSMHLSGSIT